MLDEIAIQQTLNRYTDGASRSDVQQVLSTFTNDGVYEADGVRLEGKAAIAAATSSYVAAFAYIVQLSAPAVILVEGDRATARTVVRECSKYADADELLELVGTYSDDLVRTAQGWKIAHRVFTALGAHKVAVLPWEREPAPG